MATPLDVARKFVELATSESEPSVLTHSEIQKLLYYAQGWSLALRQQPLFTDQIQAWREGPVVRSLYPHLEKYGRDRIPPHEIGPPSGLTPQEQNLILAVWNEYKAYSPLGLRDKIHREYPWKSTYHPADVDGECHEEITKQLLENFFRGELQRHPNLIPGLDPEQMWRADAEYDEEKGVPFAQIQARRQQK